MNKPALMIIDVQPSFSPPAWLVTGISALIGTMPSIATIERHDEERTPFQRQLGWAPGASDDSLIPADRIFVKHRRSLRSPRSGTRIRKASITISGSLTTSLSHIKRQSPRSQSAGWRLQITVPARSNRATAGLRHGVSGKWIAPAFWPAATSSPSSTSGSKTPASGA